MKKTIVLLFFALILLFTATTYNTKVSASSANINDLSCANGKNLIDKNNIFVDNINGNYYLKTMNNIYCPRSEDDEMTFQFAYDETYFYNPSVELILYDIDGIVVQRELNTSEYFNHLTVEGEDIYFTMFTLDQDLNPFSFEFIISGVNEEYVNDNFNGFMITHTYTPTVYEEYIKRNGLFELTDESDATIYVNFPRVLSIDDILSLISAKDAYYGDLKDRMVVSYNGYEGHESVLGKYRIQVSVSDSSDNAQSGQFYIEVVDTEKPVIEGDDELLVPVYTDIDDEYILSNYTASDEYDGDISSSMTIVGDYTTNSSTIKSEVIEIEVEDSSGNKTTKEVTISFFDNVAPNITCPLTITLSYQVRKPISNIINDSVTVSDNLDNNPILIVESDTYSGNENKIGRYQITFKATDASGNITRKTLDVVVQDLVKPVIYIDLGVIETLSTVILKVEDVSHILYKRGELKRFAKYRVEVLKDTYTGHEKTPGSYVLRLRYVSNNETIEKSLTINVTEASYTVDTFTPKIDTMLIVLISTVSILAISLVFLSVNLIVKSKKAKRHY